MAIMLIVAVLIVIVFVIVRQKMLQKRREAYIRGYRLPQGILQKIQRRHPQLTDADLRQVNKGLQQFFHVYLNSGRRYVSMPSQVVDDLWHEFILCTRHYQRFCQSAFGRYLHHTPSVVLGSVKQSNIGLRRCWRYACIEELIDFKTPTHLPLLFALDAKLHIANGFYYRADCSGVHQRGQGTAVYCGGDFSSTDFDGGTDGLDESGGGDSSDASDGCGGGCGGGD